MSYVLPLTCPMWTLNGQRQMHHYKVARMVKEVRETAAWEAKAAKLPHMEHVEIEAQPFQGKRGKLADVGAHFPAVKAAIDGLVDAGVLTDDGPEHVVTLVMHVPERMTQPGLMLGITEVDE